MLSEKANQNKAFWKSILGIVMVVAGCACFILSCVAAMILAGREQ